jgi:S1-C subfamily serine protease
MCLLRACFSALLILTLSPIHKPVAAQGVAISNERAIPEDNLAYPVLIILNNGSKGSGFFLDTTTTQYLVTANHVIAEDADLIDPKKKTYKPDAEIEAISYSRDMTDTKRNRVKINLHDLQSANNIHADITNDVVVITIGTVQTPPSTTQATSLTPVPGVTFEEMATLGTVGVALASVKRLDEVLIGNDVIVFGYPTSLGLQQLPQLDPDRPLLRKGIVAGKNLQRRSLILDCPIYFGDSGGPVFEIDRELLQTRFRLIGVVREYVPFAESTRTSMQLENSGYSVAAPMDAVLNLIQ